MLLLPRRASCLQEGESQLAELAALMHDVADHKYRWGGWAGHAWRLCLLGTSLSAVLGATRRMDWARVGGGRGRRAGSRGGSGFEPRGQWRVSRVAAARGGGRPLADPTGTRWLAGWVGKPACGDPCCRGLLGALLKPNQGWAWQFGPAQAKGSLRLAALLAGREYNQSIKVI